MREVLIDLFVQLISNYTGLRIRAQERNILTKKLWTRIESLKSSPEEYYNLLEKGIRSGETLAGIAAQREWKKLTTLLTTGESYFFRDRGQFWLLEHIMLPELINKQRKLWHERKIGKPSLRIWSAGCSTGEEPYSLAILISELIPDWENWNLTILGTDLNQEAIDKAKQGIYTSWSFRLAEPEKMPKYFHQHKNHWKINEKFRNLVKFSHGNLTKDTFPDTAVEIYDMDLIVCRNVFVYFEEQAISEVLKKFYKTLRPGGYLMTAHAELHGQNLGLLEAKVFPQSVVYQRSEKPQIDLSVAVSPYSRIVQPLPVTPAVSAPRVFQTCNRKAPAKTTASQYSLSSLSTEEKSDKIKINSLFTQAEKFFKNEQLTESLTKAEQVMRLQPRHYQACSLIAQIYANLGNYHKAEQYSKRAIELDPLSVKPYYIMAHIFEEKGDLEQAKYWYKKIIYLSPTSIEAYLDLAAIYEINNEMQRAIKMRNSALKILENIPPDSLLESVEKITAGELVTHVKKLLKKQA